MKTGVILPTFRDSPQEAYAVARDAEEFGIDGVFCHDHLWPLGQPDRPALAPFPLLGAIIAATSRVCVGTLVARIGLVPDDLLLAEFAALELLAPGRVIAGLGTGDRLSAPENEAYGVTMNSPDQRRASLAFCARALSRRGVPVWIGGGSRGTQAEAEEEGVAVNLWDAPGDKVAEQARRTEVTWAGPAPSGSTEAERTARIKELVGELGVAGASWVVFSWPAPITSIVEAARAVAGQR